MLSWAKAQTPNGFTAKTNSPLFADPSFRHSAISVGFPYRSRPTRNDTGEIPTALRKIKRRDFARLRKRDLRIERFSQTFCAWPSHGSNLLRSSVCTVYTVHTVLYQYQVYRYMVCSEEHLSHTVCACPGRNVVIGHKSSAFYCHVKYCQKLSRGCDILCNIL